MRARCNAPLPLARLYVLQNAMSLKQDIHHKLMSAEEAVSVVRSGDRVYIHSGCAEPEHLVQALIRRRQELRDVEIVHLWPGQNCRVSLWT